MAHPAQYYLSLFHNILDDDIGLFIIDTLLKTVLMKICKQEQRTTSYNAYNITSIVVVFVAFIFWMQLSN